MPRRNSALKDGYTCFAESPRTAVQTTFMSEDEAEAFDERTEMIAEFGIGRRVPRRYRPRDPDDDNWI